MHVNSLGGARMPVTPTADRSTQTARTHFGTLVQGGAAAPMTGRAGLPGSSIVATAISVNSGGTPGFGAPYRQAMSSGVPLPGVSGATQGQAPAPTPTTGGELNGELQAQFDKQKAMAELIKMSLISFISTTFSLGMNRPTPEAW